ncbi:hypothetical protein B0H21DRAFT_692447 [Amylocystis lapponica]|nr:hypothetical protein B0H21DRAFT_692447 [Amylocystis lapponica]
MFVLWDVDGNKIEDEFPPEENIDLIQSQCNTSNVSLDPSQVARIVANLTSMSGNEVKSLLVIGRNHYVVLDATFAHGGHAIVRIAHPQSHDASDIDHLNQHIRSYAHIALQMFRVPSPQKIGSIISFPATNHDGSPESLPVLGPCIDPSGRHTPSAPFETIAEYFAWLVSKKKSSQSVGEIQADIDAASQTIDILEYRLRENLPQLSPVVLRCVPSHEDFVAQNVLLDASGAIGGVIDWELHAVKSAVLAAQYPSWLSYEGSNDPQFSRAEAERLCHEFDAIVQDADPEYYMALREGVFCRAAEAWLRDEMPDFGCRRMRAWLDSL